MRRAQRRFSRREGVEVAPPLGEDAPQLLVVALTGRLLVGLHRVAPVHAAAPRALDQAGSLHVREVVELAAAVAQQWVEEVSELLGRPQTHLQGVQRGDDGGRLAAGDQHVELEAERRLLQREQALGVDTAEADHGVGLRGPRALSLGQSHEVLVPMPGAVHALPSRLLPGSLPRLIADL